MAVIGSIDNYHVRFVAALKKNQQAEIKPWGGIGLSALSWFPYVFLYKVRFPYGNDIMYAKSSQWTSPAWLGRPSYLLYLMALLRERMGVCEMTVKHTRLCYWIARPAKPGVQSSNTSRVRFTVISHTPMRSRFYHTHIMYERNWNDCCLVNLIFSASHVFEIRNLRHCVDESWWTSHLKKHDLVTVWWTMLLLCCYNCYCMQQRYDVTQFDYVLWRHTMHEWVMNIHFQNLNRPRAIHKHDPQPLETMGRVW